MSAPKKKNPAYAYEKYDNQTDFKGYAEQVAIEASRAGKVIEEDPARLQHLIRNDLRSTLPTPALGIIGRIVSAIESIEAGSGDKPQDE